MKKQENSEVYEFEAIAEFEKFYSDNGSFYGAYNMSSLSELPKSKVYNGFSIDGESNKKYFINMAGKMQRLSLGCKYKIEATLSFFQRL